MADSLDGLTLRLLRLFETIYRTRNVSHAGDLLGISQPSVSLSLNRLRELFGDPLFVRVGSRMEPTPRAKDLIEATRRILEISQEELAAQPVFDPKTSQRCFVLHMTDPGEAIIVPKLIDHLIRHAPGVTIHIRKIDEDSQSMLRDGSVDIILGYLTRESEELLQRKLFDETFVGIARADHPRLGAQVSIDDLRREGYIAVSISGTGHGDAGTLFAGLHESAKPTLQLPGYLAVGDSIAGTDLVAVVPSRLADHLSRQINLRQFALPTTSPVVQIREYWHSRFHRDPGNRWLRNLLFTLFGASPQPGEEEGDGAG